MKPVKPTRAPRRAPAGAACPVRRANSIDTTTPVLYQQRADSHQPVVGKPFPRRTPAAAEAQVSLVAPGRTHGIVMNNRRWWRIIPVALIMYTISYVDRTNVALALDPSISSMMHDLLMDDRMKGEAFGVFFFGYLLLQIPGGHLAHRWSAKRMVAIFLVLWGVAAVGGGLVKTFRQFEVMRFLLGVAESGVFPATLVLLANWFPRAERARANAYWNLCQPLAVAGSAPLTGWLLGRWGWNTMLILEGVLPFLWLPIWFYFITDHPRQAAWLSATEREHLESALARETTALAPERPVPLWRAFAHPAVLLMLMIYFLHNCAAYGCMSFLTSGLERHPTVAPSSPPPTAEASAGRRPSPPTAPPARSGLREGILFAIPYVVTALLMVLNSWHSDKTQERRAHVTVVYAMSGVALIGSVCVSPYSFWLSYALLCLAIPGPFAGMAPFWSIPAETLPRSVLGSVMGLVNAVGNLGGFAGAGIVGVLKHSTGSVTVPFAVLGVGLLAAGGLALLLPQSKVSFGADA